MTATHFRNFLGEGARCGELEGSMSLDPDKVTCPRCIESLRPAQSPWQADEADRPEDVEDDAGRDEGEGRGPHR